MISNDPSPSPSFKGGEGEKEYEKGRIFKRKESVERGGGTLKTGKGRVKEGDKGRGYYSFTCKEEEKGDGENKLG